MAKTDFIFAFDLYGTLLSTESIARKLGEHFGEEKAAPLAATWRKYQLEYTWLLNSMNKYQEFSKVTLNALRATLAENSLELTSDVQNDLMSAYDSLSTFPDVGPALKALASTEGITPIVFSNGTMSMIKNSIKNSPDLAPYADVFNAYVSVDDAGVFKPDPVVYRNIIESYSMRQRASDVWLVSGNPFDVVGARSAGMSAAWVDRAGNGWSNSVIEGERGRPNVIVKDLGEVAEAVKKHSSNT